ncbi:hypothetical protein [Sphingobium sp. LSP13-1-1.1]|uniref:hypothetical protein n=1 Tax=Sphingobium sp. LSP13-1-1.1 TaxID=3135234 RepID=UPI0034381876
MNILDPNALALGHDVGPVPLEILDPGEGMEMGGLIDLASALNVKCHERHPENAVEEDVGSGAKVDISCVILSSQSPVGGGKRTPARLVRAL